MLINQRRNFRIKSNVSKRRREGSRTKIKSMGDHQEFLKRITKTLYYGHLPTLPCLSLPVTEISCSVWSEAQRGRSLRRLQAAAAARVARGACVSPCALVLALLYLERLRACRPQYLRAAAPQDLFLISLMVGNKFLHDDGEDDEVISSEWATSGGIDLKQLNKLELEFLDAIDWNIFVNEESFESGLCWLERQVALKQGSARGFFTYSDLRVACDSGALLGALAGAGLRLAAGYLAALAALLASALLLAPACLPPPAALSSPRLELPGVPPATFLNNASVEVVIDALEYEVAAGARLACCTPWSRHRAREHPPAAARTRRELERLEPWWSRTAALSWLYWSALVSPLQRWLERVTEYAEVGGRARVVPDAPAGPRCGAGEWDARRRQRCTRQWLNLSKLSALLVTVSDR